MEEKSKKAILLQEFLSHLPFSIFFTGAGMAAAGLLLYIAMVSAPPAVSKHDQEGEAWSTAHHETEDGSHEEHNHHGEIPLNPNIQSASFMIFHLFHPIHLMLSAIATTAMFWRHEKKLFKSILIGLIGSLGICGISDIFMPYLSGLFLGVEDMDFHWCLIEHAQMILPFIFMGILCGIMASERIGQSTKYSHSSHIFVSVIASLFYLISFGVHNWVDESVFPYVFMVVILCVTIPCCVSDIIFPLLSVSCQGKECCTQENE